MRICEYCGYPLSEPSIELNICGSCLESESNKQDQGTFVPETKFGLKNVFREVLRDWFDIYHVSDDINIPGDFQVSCANSLTPKERGQLFYFLCNFILRLKRQNNPFNPVSQVFFSCHTLLDSNLGGNINFAVDLITINPFGQHQLEMIFEDPIQNDERVWKKILLQWTLASKLFPKLSPRVLISETENLRAWKLRLTKEEQGLGEALLEKSLLTWH